jgi:hypothetical protein
MSNPAQKNVSTRPDEQEAPPEEAFWQRYSPHNEFPISSASSVAAFGLGLGLLVFLGFLAGLARHDERRQPPQMDVVEIEGGGTDGPGAPGSGPFAQAKGPRAEAVEENPKSKPDYPPKTEQTAENLKDPIRKTLEVPQVKLDPGLDDPALFDQIVLEARKDIERDLQRYAPPASKENKGGKVGVKNPGNGGGQGGGSGDKIGPGGGNSKTGALLTDQERRERRWRIDFSGSGEQHLDKLRALQITLALPTGQPNQYFLVDLTRNPPAAIINNLAKQRDKEKWFNSSPASLRELARVLRLRAAPPYAVIFLPPAVEKELIRLEHDYKGLQEHQIELTEFEIQRRGGQYVPVVVSQRQKQF